VIPVLEKRFGYSPDFSLLFSWFHFLKMFQNRSFLGAILVNWLVVRASHSLASYPAESGSGGAVGKTPNQLGAGASVPAISTLCQ
jgi:hypothetical protein